MARDFDKNDLSGLRGGTAAAGPDQRGAASGPPAPELPGRQDPQPAEASASARAASAGAAAEGPRESGGIWKTIVALGAGCLTIQLVIGLVMLAGIAFGLSSCMASCSDNPIGDSRENAAFIADLTTNERDLEVIDALHGLLEDRYSRRTSGASGSGELTVDELRAQVAAGSWPKDDGGSMSPRVWVRIAELSQDWLEGQTQERWEVIDFSYPFPNNGPIPVPATRDEDSRCLTSLRCSEGDDQDLFVTVSYYRWVKEAFFEANLDEAREDATARAELLDQVAQTGLLGERRFVLSDGDLVVWEQGENDPLRDPEAFLATAGELCAQLGTYRDVSLVVADMPCILRYDMMYGDFSNTRDNEQVSFEQARERLLRAGYPLALDYASGDVLLSCYQRKDEELTLDDLTGTLAPVAPTEWANPWRAPVEGSAFNDGLAAAVAETLGTDGSQLIVTSYHDQSDSLYDSRNVWIAMPRGVMPETPRAFCAATDGLVSMLWGRIPPVDPDSDKNLTLSVRLYVVDEQTLTDAAGNPTTFAQMREVAQQRPADLEGYGADLLLATSPYLSKWPDSDDIYGQEGTQPTDVSGSIARSREWRYSSE